MKKLMLSDYEIVDYAEGFSYFSSAITLDGDLLMLQNLEYKETVLPGIKFSKILLGKNNLAVALDKNGNLWGNDYCVKILFGKEINFDDISNFRQLTKDLNIESYHFYELDNRPFIFLVAISATGKLYFFANPKEYNQDIPDDAKKLLKPKNPVFGENFVSAKYVVTAGNYYERSEEFLFSLYYSLPMHPVHGRLVKPTNVMTEINLKDIVPIKCIVTKLKLYVLDQSQNLWVMDLFHDYVYFSLFDRQIKSISSVNLNKNFSNNYALSNDGKIKEIKANTYQEVEDEDEEVVKKYRNFRADLLPGDSLGNLESHRKFKSKKSARK